MFLRSHLIEFIGNQYSLSDNQNNQHAGPVGGKQAWFVWSFAAMAFGYAFFQRVAPSVMVSDLMGDFAIGGAVLGTLSALYFYPYVFLQIPLGSLLDVIGTRILLSSAIAFAAAGSIIFGLAVTIEIAYLGRIMIGIGSSVGFLASLSLTARWFPVHQFSLLAGLTMFFGMISGMLAQAPLAIIIGSFGWRNSMWGLGGFGLLLALLILIFVRNNPPASNSDTQNKLPKKSFTQSWNQMKSGLSYATTSLEVWKVAFIASTLSGPMLALGALWGTPYLMSAYDIQRPKAAFLVSLLLIGWAVGAPTFGWLTDRYRHRKRFLIAGSAILSLCTGLMVFLPLPPLWVTVMIFITIGTSGSIMTATFAHIRARTPSEYSGSVTGIVNSMTVASGAVLQPLVGLSLDYMWDGTLLNGARFYSAVQFQWSFSIIFVSTLIGLVIAIRLK
jgi:MFS family permease